MTPRVGNERTEVKNWVESVLRHHVNAFIRNIVLAPSGQHALCSLRTQYVHYTSGAGVNKADGTVLSDDLEIGSDLKGGCVEQLILTCFSADIVRLIMAVADLIQKT